ncbi:cell surface glycoprotein 1-like [Anabas testudineus]|uniref:cell surface glycoprotein 1-like n=1 Tax=Anabas testudineus TaxID=64144 RepID=UPI000E456753|nr:cell surface glycoprotein 1-like [Anabas testudineus]
MGNKVTRRRDTPEENAETSATAEEPAEEPEETQTQEDSEPENLDVVVGEPVTLVACLPREECISECKNVECPAAALNTQNDAEPEPVAEETPAPVQPELLVSISDPPPKSEPAEEPKPAVEAQLAPKPEPTSNAETETEAVPEPSSELVPDPAEAPEQQTDMLTQEPLPKPVISSPTLINLGVPDVTLQPVDTPPAPAPIHNMADADEPSDIPVNEECQDGAEATFEPEKPEDISESLEEPMEATDNLEQLVTDASEDSVSRLLKNLELQGNDLVPDLIPSDVKIPDDTPITDICRSTELM